MIRVHDIKREEWRENWKPLFTSFYALAILDSTQVKCRRAWLSWNDDVTMTTCAKQSKQMLREQETRSSYGRSDNVLLPEGKAVTEEAAHREWIWESGVSITTVAIHHHWGNNALLSTEQYNKYGKKFLRKTVGLRMPKKDWNKLLASYAVHFYIANSR